MPVNVAGASADVVISVPDLWRMSAPLDEWPAGSDGTRPWGARALIVIDATPERRIETAVLTRWEYLVRANTYAQ
jgi:hypothetical protein